MVAIEPGGRLAFYEIIAGSGPPRHFPVPWATTPQISFLGPEAEILDALRAAGLRERVREDVSARATEALRAMTSPRPDAPSSPGLVAIMGDRFPAMAKNILRNLDEGTLRVVRGVFER